MNLRILFAAFIVLSDIIAPVELAAQSKKGFTVSGHLYGLHDGDIAKIGNRFEDWHYRVITDSCKVVNGNFNLRVNDVPAGPHQFEIVFYDSKGVEIVPPNGDIGILNVFANNGDVIAISGSIDKWQEIQLFGSVSNDAYRWASSLVASVSRRTHLLDSRLWKIRDSIGYDENLVQDLVKQKEGITTNLDSVINAAPAAFMIGVPYLIYSLNQHLPGYRGYFQKNLYDRLSPEIKNTYYGELSKAYAPLSIGQSFPDFLLDDPKGRSINLKRFCIKNNITIVHFWGTISFWRERLQSELKEMYGRFHSKGLNIIAVSADTSLDDWKFMIHQKKYPWTNVIAEPKGWKSGSLLYDVYGEGGHSIPNTTNVLLDKRGRILAWDAHGAELQYYLNKYLN